MTPRKVLRSEGRSIERRKDFALVMKSNGPEGLMTV